jgi:hypothetical protein
MPNWKPIVGLSFQPKEFYNYCHSLHFANWRPSFIVLHNTGLPTLAQKPNGLSKIDINGLVSYYRDDQHWSAGPHLFIDDHQIWVFTPLTTSGVHSPSWNQVSWGVEMLGDYAVEEFDSGRGLAVQKNAIAALSTLYGVLGIEVNDTTFRLHHEDPKTTHNCPGIKVLKEKVKAEIIAAMHSLNEGEHDLSSVSS